MTSLSSRARSRAPPIALAAGAAYGHYWGPALVVIGVDLGALIAFWLARGLGHEVL
jgi:uncharacterized membrane protein YdjX (TVP38/TMEM64 family)